MRVLIEERIEEKKQKNEKEVETKKPQQAEVLEIWCAREDSNLRPPGS